MSLLRAASLLLTLLALFGLAGPAQAFDQKTQWFTIMAQPVGDGAPLFLTSTSDGLMFEPYSSGDSQQMWTTVDIDYPVIPRVTSDSGIDIAGGLGAVFDCMANGFSGCSFSVSVGKVTKVVSRASGGCLVFGPHYYAVTRPCLINTDDEAYQLWRVYSADRAAVTFTARSGDGSCLASDTTSRRGTARALASGCNKVPPGGRASFVLQLAADLSCTTDYYWHICFK